MKYGHFVTRDSEYVIDRPDVPVSWTNYLGTKNLGTVISHNGGGYSYFKNAQSGRITRFRQNGVPLDRPGKYVYLRDDADGDFWSISWQPVGKPLGAGKWSAAHGLGYTRFEAAYQGIKASQTVFIPLDDDVEVWDVRLTNTGKTARTITVTGYVEFSFHNIEIDNQNLQMSLYSQGADYADGVIECDAFYEPWTFNYFTSNRPGKTGHPLHPSSYDCLRDSFIGPYHTEANPVGVTSGHCHGSEGTTQNHCGAIAHKITIEPGETARVTYLLGHGSRAEAGIPMRQKYTPDQVDEEFARLKSYWREKQDRLQIHTPNPGMDELINAWTLLQAETCVVWSRFASFIEVGGRVGLGYRDTAQDAMSVIHSNPAKCRQRIVELLRAQTLDGFGLHLFSPEDFDPDAPPKPDFPTPTIVPKAAGASLIHGMEDVCSDDHLWLVSTIVEYVKETGDTAFLDEVIPYAEFADDPKKHPDAKGTVWEHCTRALDFTAKHVGANGVAKGLRADWNDCLNLGGGETALVTFLHAWAMREFIDLAHDLGRGKEVAKYEKLEEKLADVADKELWDGNWWRRGITRAGVLVGSNQNEQGKIFLEHQAWPTIAGITTPERGRKTMDAIHKHLASPYGSHLNWPSFTKPDDTVGFLTRVYPGIKENGAIFSHPNAWPIIAETVLGRGNEAMKFYDSILPYNQNDLIEVRQFEPYAYVQFIYGKDHPKFGLAQNPWLTGTAGWMYTAATKYILGVRPTLEGLVIDPVIPHDWPEYTMQREWRGATYEITVKNPAGRSSSVHGVTVDGVPLAPVPVPDVAGTDGHGHHRKAALIPIAEPGSTVKVEVTL